MATTKNGIYYPGDYSSKADVPADFKKQAESIDVKIDDLKGKDATNEANMQALEGRVQTSETNISNLQADNTTNKTDISNIKKEQTTQNTNISNLQKDNTTNKANIATNTQDISDIKDKDTEQDTELEAIKAENERLRNDLNSTAITEEAEGESITISDTAEARFKKYEIEGNSKQEISTQSANILDLTKINIHERSHITVNDIKANEVSVTSTEIAESSYIRIKTSLKAGTWYLSRKYEILSGTEGSITGQCLVQKTSDWSTIATLRKTQNKVSFTLAEDTEIYIAFSLKSSSIAIAEEGVISARFYEIMLSNENIDYVSFAPNMPSIEYPSEIQTVKDNIDFVVSNKNLYNATTNERTVSGLTSSADKTSLKLNGTPTTNLKHTFRAITLPKGTYSLNLKIKEGSIISSTSQGALFYMYIYNSGKYLENKSLNIKDETKQGKLTFRLEKSTQLQLGLFARTSETFSNAIIEHQITKGEETDFNFIENQSQSFTTPVQQEMLEGDGYEKVDDVWKEKHNWLKIILDGENNKVTQAHTGTEGKFRYTFNTLGRFGKKIKNCSTSENIAYCSHLKLGEKGKTYALATGFTAADNYVYLYTNGKTADEFNEELKTNNMTFYLPLEKTELIESTAEQKAVLDEIEKNT